MKELSIEEKAKRYDEAIEELRGLLEGIHEEKCDIMEEDIIKIFPELKESEDERIRKALITFFQRFPYENIAAAGTNAKEAIAWLEKQGNLMKALQISNSIIAELVEEKYNLEEKLKKQGEQKPVEPQQDMLSQEKYAKAVDECVYGEQNPADVEELNFFDDFRKTDSEVEPKFKVGDYIINSQGTLRHIINVDKVGYQTDEGWLSHDVYEKTFHLWTIQDAKDGDVLVNWNNTIYLFKGIEEEVVKFYCYYNTNCEKFSIPLDNNSHLGLTEPQFEHHPATKKQRNLLFQKMKEAGYEWDAEKLELKKIEQKQNINIQINPSEYINDMGGNGCYLKNTTQKPAWSENDEKGLGDALWCCKQSASSAKDENDMGNVWYAENWLKSLKDRVQPQPKQEWSEEDEKMRAAVLQLITDSEKENGWNCVYCNDKEIYFSDIIAWFKSLKDRYTWKPSDEQIQCLSGAVAQYYRFGYYDAPVLKELVEQLEKLKD